jgi:GMP synthase-like glutamine amidotransferase
VRRFHIVNGFLIPGGGQKLRAGHPWFDASTRVFELAVRENDRGGYFPILGICLGFETLAVISAGGAPCPPRREGGRGRKKPTGAVLLVADARLTWDT